jgi:O-antigen/teichoic acid export membrane protein
MFLFYVYPVYGKLGLWPILKFRKKFITPHLRVALPMIPHNYSSFLLNSSDRIVMDIYKIDIRRIGIYNISYQFGNYFEAIGDAIGMAVGPFYSKLYTEKKEKSLTDARALTFFLMGCFLVSTFLISLWLREIFLGLIKNEELRSAYDVGIIIIMGYAYRPMYWSAGIKLSIFEDTAMLWRISFVAGILNLGLNLIFVPFYGIYAAAIITLISLLYIGFSGFFFKRYKKLGGPDHHPFKWIVGILLLTSIAYIFKDAMITTKVIISSAILAISFLIFKRYYSLLKTIEI